MQNTAQKTQKPHYTRGKVYTKGMKGMRFKNNKNILVKKNSLEWSHGLKFSVLEIPSRTSVMIHLTFLNLNIIHLLPYY